MSKSWIESSTGLLLPAEHSTSKTTTGTETYLDMKEKAVALETFYAEEGVNIPKHSGVDVLIQSAKELSDAWLMGGARDVTKDVLHNAAHLSRVADAASVLHGDPQCKNYLKRLASGNLDLLNRERSEAKDILWELELLNVLRLHHIEAQLAEPPDIIAKFSGVTLGLACKKLYTEKNVEKVLSGGVAQIEREFEYGIVALNLDDLLQRKKVVVQRDYDMLGRSINNFNLEFMRRHERHFRKYLTEGRILSAFVSTGCLAYLRNGGVGFHNARQSTGWTIPELQEDKHKVFRSFYKSFITN